MSKHEIVKHEGSTYLLVREPMIAGLHEEPVFKATAKNLLGELYEVTWELVDDWKELAVHGDNSILVEDWTQATSVKPI